MKQVIGLSILLSLSLVGSYTTFFGEQSRELRTGEVAVYNVNGLTQVAWTSEKLDVVLDKKIDAQGEYLWVSITERREVPKPLEPTEEPAEDEDEAGEDEGADKPDDADAPPAEPEKPEMEIVIHKLAFKGNGTADDLWENLNPLIAMRPLTLPEGVDNPFGFDEPSATLTLQAGKTLSLVVGGETFGAKDRYLQHENNAFLVGQQTLRPLQYGKTRLLERTLQPLAEADVDTVKLITPERTMQFSQQNAGDRAKAFWSIDSAPETEHEIAGPWFGKVFKMRAKQYVEDPSTLGELTSVFRFETQGDGKTWTLEVLESAETPGTYYAKSDFLRSTVELTKSLATDAVVDLRQLVE